MYKEITILDNIIKNNGFCFVDCTWNKEQYNIPICDFCLNENEISRGFDSIHERRLVRAKEILLNDYPEEALSILMEGER